MLMHLDDAKYNVVQKEAAFEIEQFCVIFDRQLSISTLTIVQKDPSG